ncbi:DNA polymerase III subunit delta' [Deinococcus cellulosilyticus]|uniref:DNA polymerase III n=1 Tax=Deinococcus cellulosilyticus (strain DSM 18568 / NBRC 106333 / KACC 11606 / 5516J-15) TaxID=1223518 RepID=A0A511NBI2_DEIC1|nr:DNA polymerase III subunit delta' [Deinococcus cellulosilyticus]GEM49926.1 DNA polymerase III [Deinococcus cellulosilyticus NBRC 106333 = KACC 11606]
MNPFDIIGHQDVLQTLRTQSAHAFLLLGPHRVGRKAVAHFIAALANCAYGTACGNCPSCLAIARDTHTDVMLVSPKTETSTGKQARKKLIPVKVITERRDETHEYDQHVVEWLYIAPHTRRKVVIFDGAEYLNNEAANALLKTLEEPPHRSMFVFIAEDQQLVIPTIVSRCARIFVPPVPEAQMQQALMELENNIDPELLEFAAGRPGVLFERETVREALSQARALVQGLESSMLDALMAAEKLEKTFNPEWHPEALLFAFRHHPLSARAKADLALSDALEALEQYANPALVFQVLALKLREALGVV